MAKKYSRRKHQLIPGPKWAENRIGRYKILVDNVYMYFMLKKDAIRFKKRYDNDKIHKLLGVKTGRIIKLKGSYW